MIARRAMISEVAVAAPIVAWLDGLFSDVYQETKVHALGGWIADVVATRAVGRATLVAVAEVKVRLTLEVIAQGTRWQPYAHATWIATPALPPGRTFDAALRVCRALGLGWLGSTPSGATEIMPAPYRRHVFSRVIREALLPGQKTYRPAGSPGGQSWTPWRETCEGIAALVRSRPAGVLVGDVLGMAATHYRSPLAYRAILGAVERGQIAGVQLRREGYRLLLCPR